MILLDTMVVSAMMRPDLNPVVVSWIDRQEATRFHVTTITVMELWAGIVRLPASARKRTLEIAFDRLTRLTLRDRIIEFDFAGALAAAELLAGRLRTGRSVETRDTQIAGIAVSRGAAIATRNVRHFEDLPVDVINPWGTSD
jgi:predicted nucleic acid-binding protein